MCHKLNISFLKRIITSQGIAKQGISLKERLLVKGHASLKENITKLRISLKEGLFCRKDR